MPVEPLSIVDWEPIADYPRWQELREPPMRDVSEGLERGEPDFTAYRETYGTAEGDKLDGWPYWIQGVEYPDCLECGERMDYLFQIDSDDHIDHGFGDLGCAHLTQCPEHPDQLGFGWACG